MDGVEAGGGGRRWRRRGRQWGRELVEDSNGSGDEDDEGVGEDRWRQLHGAVRGIESNAVGEDGDGGGEDGSKNRWRWRWGGGGDVGATEDGEAREDRRRPRLWGRTAMAAMRRTERASGRIDGGGDAGATEDGEGKAASMREQGGGWRKA